MQVCLNLAMEEESKTYPLINVTNDNELVAVVGAGNEACICLHSSPMINRNPGPGGQLPCPSITATPTRGSSAAAPPSPCTTLSDSSRPFPLFPLPLLNMQPCASQSHPKPNQKKKNTPQNTLKPPPLPLVSFA